MLSTLILPYALDTGQIPTGCYIVAWAALMLEVVVKVADIILKSKNN